MALLSDPKLLEALSLASLELDSSLPPLAKVLPIRVDSEPPKPFRADRPPDVAEPDVVTLSSISISCRIAPPPLSEAEWRVVDRIQRELLARWAAA